MAASAYAGCKWCMQQLLEENENLLAYLQQGWNLWDCVHHYGGHDFVSVLRFLEDRGLASSDKYKKWVSKRDSDLKV